LFFMRHFLSLLPVLAVFAHHLDEAPINPQLRIAGWPDCVQTNWRANATKEELAMDLVCQQKPKQNSAQISVACVGDSITAGACSSGPSMTYPSQLQQMLGSGYLVTNLGACGATLQKKADSPYWNRPQYTALIQGKWDIVVIMLGTNDAKDKGSGGPSNWPHDCGGSDPLANCAFGTDYAALIAKVHTLGNPKIFVNIPPPLMEQGAIGANQTVINTVFPTIVPLISKFNKLPSPPIDVFGTMGGVADWRSRFPAKCNLESPWPDCKLWCDSQSCDQCHPNDVGYKVLADAVHKAITA